MKYFDVCTKREYDKGGEKKVAWLKCGTIRKTDDGKEFMELNMFPTTSFYIFEQKDKTAKKEASPADIAWEQ